MCSRSETDISSPPESESSPESPDEPVVTTTAQTLLADVATGDQRAFEQLYDVVAMPLFGLVTRVVRDRALVEEVAQEVLVEVWRTAPGYRPERGRALTWVLTLAHRRAVDRVRSTQAGIDRDAKVAAGQQTRSFDEVAESVFARWEQQQVQQALTSLTELQRHALVMTYYHGYTCRDAADLLGIPTSTVKTRVRDALVRLRDCLAHVSTDATGSGGPS